MKKPSFEPVKNRSLSVPGAAVVVLVSGFAACGGGTPSDPGGGGNGGGPVDPGVLSCTPSGSMDGWQFTRLGEGTKPAIAVAADGTVHAAFLTEALSGWVRYATLAPGTTEPPDSQIVASGYFYGPIDVALGGDGQPLILYHDHDREDQVLAQGNGAGFDLIPMENAGHDGWYNTGAVGPDGTLHTVTYDPRGFAGRGLNYGAWDGTGWFIELAAAGSFDYAGGTAISLAQDRIYAAFFDDLAGLGKLASRDGPNSWNVSTIEPREGRLEVGRFPDMAVDPDGTTLHLVYLAVETSTNSVIRYARGTPGAFEFQDLLSITDFSLGFAGARDIATLDLDEDGNPVVAVQTLTEMTVLRLGSQGVETLAQFQPNSGVSFTQQTEVVVDGSGQVHVVWWQAAGAATASCHGLLSGS